MSKAQRWLVLATVSAGLLMVSVDTTVLYTALPTLTSHLHAGASQKLWIINAAYPLVMAGHCCPVQGTLGDRIGPQADVSWPKPLALFQRPPHLLAAFAPSPPVLHRRRPERRLPGGRRRRAMLPRHRGTDPHHSFDDEHERRRIAIGDLGLSPWRGTRRRAGPDRRRKPAAPALLVGLGLLLLNIPVVRLLALAATAALVPGELGVFRHRDRPWGPDRFHYAGHGRPGRFLVLRRPGSRQAQPGAAGDRWCLPQRLPSAAAGAGWDVRAPPAPARRPTR